MKIREVRSREERIEKAKIICQLYSMRRYSIANCCKAVGVSYDTFKDWAQVWLREEDIKSGNYRPGFIPAVYALYKKAIRGDDKIHWEYLVLNRVRESLLLKVGISYYEEIITKVVFDSNGSVDHTLINKTIKVRLPNTRALISLYKALCND